MRYFVLGCLITMTVCAMAQADVGPTKHQRAAYIQSIAKQYHIDRGYLRSVLNHAHKNEAVLKAINHPFEKAYWPRYQKHFLGKKRIAEGVTYWHTHRRVLEKIAKRYHVDASVIVAIIGVETHYGNNKGHFKALDALWTLAFYYPKRADFFKKQLTQFLVLTKKQSLPALKLESSYAGALGIPQFMPGVYNRLGVDYDHRHHADLFNQHADAIASVANYLHHSHWVQHAPVAVPCPTKYSKSTPPKNTTRIALQQSKKQSDYWLAYPNFRAIMTYNNSINYAMAVFQLSQAIQTAYDKRYAHHS